MLAEVMSNQTPCLHILELSGNYFSSATTEKLLTRIVECGVLSCLKELGLYASANFDSDESVRKVADILALSPNLTKCDISRQRGNREVVVEVKYACEGRMGAVVIKHRRTGQEIYRSETAKQQPHHQMQIDQ